MCGLGRDSRLTWSLVLIWSHGFVYLQKLEIAEVTENRSTEDVFGVEKTEIKCVGAKFPLSFVKYMMKINGRVG